MAKMLSNGLKVSIVLTCIYLIFLIFNKVKLKPNLPSRKPSIKSAFNEVHLKECQCSRNISANDDTVVDFGATTCGMDAFQRGSRQKVISYSYFGDPQIPTQRQYFQGIALNAQRIHQLYPGWVMRVYHNLTNKAQLCNLTCHNFNLDFCDIKFNPQFGSLQSILPTIWRFVPLVDDQVSIAMFRDLDSVVSAREKSAVQAWIRSKHVFHFMRDHPGHNMEILAGMWGVKGESMRNTLAKVVFQILQDRAARAQSLFHSNDQLILAKYLWEWGKDLALQHDSYHCQDFSKTSAFPTQREMAPNNFVGAPFVDQSSLNVSCPPKCRPRDHRNWEYC